jgi:hypothetical protein
LEISANSANIPGCDFEWIEFRGEVTGRIGICDLGRMPAKISVENLLQESSDDVEYVICKDSESVEKNSTGLSIQLTPKGSRESTVNPVLSGKPFSSSGFRTLYRSDRKPLNIVFLNVSGLDSGEMEFILRYIKEQHSVYRGVQVDSSRLMNTIFETEWEMERKYGFRPRMDSEAFISRVQNVHLALARSWVDHVTLKNVLHASDKSDISRYVSRRLKLMREGFPECVSRIAIWGSFYEIFCQYLNICCICMALPPDDDLRSSCSREVTEMHLTVAAAAAKHHVPSLGKALSVLLNELLQEDVYRDQRNFELRVPLAVEKSRMYLDPEFHEPSWIVSLCEEGQEHMRAISLCPEMMDESVINTFIEECDRIAGARNSNQLIAWMASRAKLEVLIALGYFIHDPCICPIVEQLATQNLARFEGEVPTMNEICPDIPVCLGDLLLDILGTMSLCFTLGDSTRVRRLRILVEERMASPSARIVRLNLLWTDFFAYEDYDALLTFRSLLAEVQASNEPSKELPRPDFEMRELVADGILNEKGRFENLARGRLKLLQVELSPEVAVKDTLQYSAFEHILGALFCLYKAAASQAPSELASNLHDAMNACEYIRLTERDASPGHLFYLKTLLLEKMILGNSDEASEIVRKIEQHPFCSRSGETLAGIANRWIEAKGNRVMKVLSALGNKSYSQSPWIVVANRVIAVDARTAYSEILERGESRDLHLEKSGAPYWKGLAFELGIEICYWNEGFQVRHRPREGHKEQVDVLCYKTSMGVCEIILIDVKSGKGTYKPKDARDFCSRVHDLERRAPKILELPKDQSFGIKGVIASRGSVTSGAEEELEKGLKTVPYLIMSGEQLMKFLADHKVSMPSLAK